jgi:DNA-3-methyladenine glycosylase I
VPVHDDRVFFEFLILEGAQAGLSWSTILNKRDGYRAAFAGFDPARWRASSRRSRAAHDQSGSSATASRSRARHQRQSVSRSAARVRHFDRYVWAFVRGKPL